MSIRFVKPDDVAAAIAPRVYAWQSDRSFSEEVACPESAPQHEQEVRDRIVRAALQRVRRARLPPRDDAGHRPRQRPVGRRDLHLLQEQVRADPRRLRPDHRPGAGRARPAAGAGRGLSASGSRPRSATGSTRSTSSSRQLAAPASSLLAWAEVETDPGDPRDAPPPSARDPRRRPSVLLQEGVIARGELPAWLDVDRVAAGARRRCSTGCIIQSIEEGAGYRRSDAERRVLALIELLIAAPRRRPPAARAGRRPARRTSPVRGARRVVTVARGSRPDRPRADRPGRPRLGPAPRAHRDRALARRRTAGTTGSCGATSRSSSRSWPRSATAGGGTVVDLTLAGRRARPGLARRAVARRPASTSSWAPAGIATPTTRPRRSIDRRSVDALADEIVREATDGRRRDRHPGRDHRRDRHGQAVDLAARGAGPSRRGPGRPPDRPRDHDPRRPVDGRARPARRLRGGGRRPVAGRHRPRRLEPVARLPPRDRRARRVRRVRLPRHDASRRSSATARAGSSSRSASCSARGHVERVLLSQDVCHDSPAPALRRQRLHLPRRDVPAAAPRGRRLRRRDPDDHGRQPAAAADDRLTAGRATRRPRALSPRASPRPTARRCPSAPARSGSRPSPARPPSANDSWRRARARRRGP